MNSISPISRCRFPVLAALATLGAVGFSMPYTPDPDDGDLLLPKGFRAMVVADRLNEGRTRNDVGRNEYDMIRFLAVAPNGDLYAKTFRGGIFALRDTTGDGRMDLREQFGFGGGTDIEIRGEWLYHSTNSALLRYRRKPGQLIPEGDPETIIRGLLDKPTHNAKSFAFDDQGSVLVEIGAPVNVFVAPNGIDSGEIEAFQKFQGGFWRFNANRLNQTFEDGVRFSTGSRHSLAFVKHPVSQDFFMIQMGRDLLNKVAPEFYDALDNAERISEEMHRLVEGANLGWPSTYYDPIKKARMLAPEYGGDNRLLAPPGIFSEPVVAFPAHWAPLQMAIYTGSQYPRHYLNGAFISFHGSWNRAPRPQEGYNVTFVPFDENGQPTGSFEVFARRASEGNYRMGGAAVAPDGSLFVSDTEDGRIWRIFYTGEDELTSTSKAISLNPSQPAKEILNTAGRDIYLTNCAACHMPDGGGAGHLQPALIGSPIIAGDPDLLVQLILRGPAAVLPTERKKFANIMPEFSILKDDQIADLTSYLREAFANDASSVHKSDVSRSRSAQ